LSLSHGTRCADFAALRLTGGELGIGDDFVDAEKRQEEGDKNAWLKFDLPSRIFEMCLVSRGPSFTAGFILQILKCQAGKGPASRLDLF
jgi:hypothetical protein